jgi:hypothetical protein
MFKKINKIYLNVNLFILFRFYFIIRYRMSEKKQVRVWTDGW